MTPLREAIEMLKDHHNILSFSKAMEFCYIHGPLFKVHPTYKQYFHPFHAFKGSAYYYIADYNQYSPEMLEDDERKTGLAIIYIILIGLSDEQITSLETRAIEASALSAPSLDSRPLEPQSLDSFLRTYTFSSFPISEFYDLGDEFHKRYEFNFPIKFDKISDMYGIPHTDDDKRVAIFSLELS
jgi:hypothetical protein